MITMDPNGDAEVEHDPTVSYKPETKTGETGTAEHLIGAFRYALVVERGPRTGLTYVLGDGDTSAGRLPANTIFLGDVSVSRNHALFTADSTGLRVKDLGSTNGTYINGEREEEKALVPGDKVIIGRFHLVVVKGDG